MATMRFALNVARAKFFNVGGAEIVKIKQTTTKLISVRSLTNFQFSNATFIKSINSSFTRSLTTESTNNTINENNTKLDFPHNKRRRTYIPYSPEIAEVVLYNRIKWMRDNLYDRCGMLRYSSIFEGMRWQDIIKLSRYELTLMGVKDIESAWKLGSCFWIIRCNLAIQEGKRLPFKGGKDRVNDKNWREIIDMDYKDLKALGIDSINDRMKLIKNFWAIRRKLYHIERIEKCFIQTDKKTEEPNDSGKISNTG
ncbi:13622_t:CDS:2 [Racocetra persica]|uniref:13622_t:CDS:1 n=1 Tax=Racocetra persica TaxID=160502 RepID=A0ACA9LPI1_9GLOM|nr:13622_t:CDS:2 [Racocetra persica]